MGLFSNPLSYAGYPANTITAQKVNSTVRAATSVEALAGVLNDVYISPATYSGAGGELGPRTLHGVILGEGTTNPLGATAAGADGKVLTGNTSADPTFSSIGTKSGLTAHGVIVAEGASAFVATSAGSNGQLLIAATTADPAFATLTSNGSLNFTTGANSLVAFVQNGGFTSVNQTSSPVTMVKQNSYINSFTTGQLNLTLPLVANAAQGNVYQIIGSNVNGWTLGQNATQVIHIGSQVSTIGVNGSVTANSAFCSLTLTCIDAGVTFIATASTGTFTVI